jgi:hypothetical protein
LKILRPFCTNSSTFPLESDEKPTAKSTKNWQSTSCNSYDVYLKSGQSTVWSTFESIYSRQYGQLLKP